MSIHWDILDETRRKVLPELALCREHAFYLAGGTALALQLGHRDSEDFDFFTEHHFDTALWSNLLAAQFKDIPLVKVQDEPDTLTVIGDNSIKLSFMRYAPPLLRPHVHSEHIDLASIADIACMKLSAIVGRATMKDYVDLYVILDHIPLPELLALCAVKLPQLDRTLVVKAMAYFDDLIEEPIRYPKGKAISFDKVKMRLRNEAAKGYR